MNQVFDDYLKYSGVSITMLKGKRVLEIGSGDNSGVAQKFLTAGAKQNNKGRSEYYQGFWLDVSTFDFRGIHGANYE